MNFLIGVLASIVGAYIYNTLFYSSINQRTSHKSILPNFLTNLFGFGKSKVVKVKVNSIYRDVKNSYIIRINEIEKLYNGRLIAEIDIIDQEKRMYNDKPLNFSEIGDFYKFFLGQDSMNNYLLITIIKVTNDSCLFDIRKKKRFHQEQKLFDL